MKTASLVRCGTRFRQ